MGSPLTAAVLLAALLSLLAGPHHRCLRQRAPTLAAQAEDAARADGVPVATLLVVGYLESHLGCAPRSGGCWGAPVDPQHRHTAGTPRSASRALAWGYRRCGSTLGAVAHFRCGRCRCGRLVGYTPADAVALLARVVARAAAMKGDR